MNEPIAKENAFHEVSQTGRLFVISAQKCGALRLVPPGTGDVQTEAAEVMKALGAVLTARGLRFEQVVKATISVTDPEDAARVEKVVHCFFDGMTPPACTTNHVATLPDGARVDVELITLA